LPRCFEDWWKIFEYCIQSTPDQATSNGTKKTRLTGRVTALGIFSFTVITAYAGKKSSAMITEGYKEQKEGAGGGQLVPVSVAK